MSINLPKYSLQATNDLIFYVHFQHTLPYKDNVAYFFISFAGGTDLEQVQDSCVHFYISGICLQEILLHSNYVEKLKFCQNIILSTENWRQTKQRQYIEWNSYKYLITERRNLFLLFCRYYICMLVPLLTDPTYRVR